MTGSANECIPLAGSRRRSAPDSIGRNLGQIARLEAEQIQARSLTERIAGAVTRAAGTASFAIVHVIWFAGWIVVNGGFTRRFRPFDPFPFSLLTMIVSLEAIFLSIWILISQNQMSRQADRREHLDLQINLTRRAGVDCDTGPRHPHSRAPGH